jgi:hypothetical protein
MEPLLILGGVALIAQHYSKKKEIKPADEYYYEAEPELPPPVINPTGGRFLYNAQGVPMGPGYGTGLEIASPSQVQAATGIPLIKKDGIPSFQVLAPDASRNPFRQAVPDLYDRSAELITNVMNNQAPFPKQNVGRGLGVGADVPAAGGFHTDYRILTQNINENRLTSLAGPGADMSNRGASVIPGVALANGFEPPNISKYKTYESGTANPGPASGATRFHIVPDSDQIRTERPTLKEQTLNTVGGWGINHSQVPAPQSQGDIAMYTSNRGTESNWTAPGGNQSGYADSGEITRMSSDNNSIPQGYKNASTFQNPRGSIGAVEQNAFKSTPNPYSQNLGSIANLAARNPLMIPSFGRPQ